MKVNRTPKEYIPEDNETVTGEIPEGYTLRVKDMADQHKPRSKLISSGPHSLTLAELMAVLFGVGTRNEDVLLMSKRILKEYGDRAIINELDPERLSDLLKIPLHKACQLIASLELGRRFYSQQAGKSIYITRPGQAYDYLSDMSKLQKEQLRGLYLNSRYKVIHEEIISIGTLTTNLVHPREVFQPAIQHGAAGVILAHNHPSGCLSETFADKEVTERLVIASGILGFDLLDHLIIAGKQYKSIMPADDE